MAQTLLVIEDDIIFHDLYGRMLRYSSTKADFVATLEDAITKLEETEYDAVITDLRLTQTDKNEGLQVIAHIVHHTPDCPVILTTGADAIIAAKHIQALPNIRILLKPFNRGEFKKMLKSIGIAIDDQRASYMRPQEGEGSDTSDDTDESA